MSSTSSSSDSVIDDDVVSSESEMVTDADIAELESILSAGNKTVSNDELLTKKAAEDILKRSSGNISMVCVSNDIEIDAANLLVDQCLFLSTEDLFEDKDYIDPNGYIKYVPDDIDMSFT
jgi:hypothetical protein